MNVSPDISTELKAAKKGDLWAEKAIYQICYERCFKIARLYSHDENEAIATFNYSMLDVFKALRQIEGYDHLMRLTTVIVKRDCIDLQRKKTVYRRKLSTIAENSKHAEAYNSGISQLTMEEIFFYISELDSKYRLCFNLHVVEGYSYKEIANTLNININTAKWYVREARKKLQETIKYSDSFFKIQTL